MALYKKILYLFSLLSFFFFLGFLLFLFKKDILVVKFFWTNQPSKKNIIQDFSIAENKKIKFFYFNDNKFDFEERKLIYFKDKVKSLKHLVNNWLSFLQEEKILTKTILLETVCLDKDKLQAYFSFDKAFFDKDWSIYKKWNFIESLLKTIRESDINLSYINFLVNHKRMADEHLDFYNPIPVAGFY